MSDDLIRLFQVYMAPDAPQAVGEVLTSGYIGQGPKVEEFEARLAKRLKNPYVLTVNSGTSALQLALRLAGVGHGDTVLSSPMTCMATNEPILAAGASPRWVDVDPVTGNIDPEGLPVDNNGIKALIVIHWGGNPVNLERIWEWAAPRGITVIEDAAHAFGAVYRGQQIGTLLPQNRTPDLRRFTCFSFQAIKHLTTVDGGLLVCQNEADYRRGKLLRWYGIDREGPQEDFRCEADVAEWGYKFHLNDVCATVGLMNLSHIDAIIAGHRFNAGWLDRHLSGVRPAAPYLVGRQERTLSSYWLYTVHVSGGLRRRDAFMRHVRNRGIQCSKVHARNDTHSCFAPYRRDLPGVEAFYSSMCCLPVGWWLSLEDLERIAQAVNSFHG